MAILTHGSDLTLAPTAAPIIAQRGITLRAALDLLSERQFAAVQLDITMAGLRPRELDQRARKDLLSLLTRRGIRLVGLDIFLPHKHFTDPAHLDRAMAATLAAIELAADLGRVPVSTALPVAALAEDARSALIETADGRGVTLAVQGEGQWDALHDWVRSVDLPALGMGIDPAMMLAVGDDPVRLVHQHARWLRVARVSDLATGQAGRCSVGQGDLDLAAYRIALDLATARLGPVVLDLRGLPGALSAAEAANHAWHTAAFPA